MWHNAAVSPRTLGVRTTARCSLAGQLSSKERQTPSAVARSGSYILCARSNPRGRRDLTRAPRVATGAGTLSAPRSVWASADPQPFRYL
eukprot:5615426-Prymnesium_polylepis.1